MRIGFIAAIVALAGTPAGAHRLDEYLQGTLISVDRNRMEAQMTLTPGVAVFPFVIASIDTDGNGIISEAEQRAYAASVLRDVSINSDGHRLTPQLASAKFPSMDDMKEGRGEIRLDFRADLPAGSGSRKLTIENRHQSRISAYQVNCLVPQDPDIQIAGQVRNYSQSSYQLEYTQSGIASGLPHLPQWTAGGLALSSTGLLLLIRFVFLSRTSHG